jgi:hypothetical protein
MTSLITHEWDRSALYALYTNSGVLEFGPRAWVPDEYETLEQMGLVKCEFGYYDAFNPVLQSRTIKLTALGLDEAKSLTNVKIPRYVEYSYRTALKREKLI